MTDATKKEIKEWLKLMEEIHGTGNGHLGAEGLTAYLEKVADEVGAELIKEEAI